MEFASFADVRPCRSSWFCWQSASSRVVVCPITGEKRFDVEYKQVFAHTTSGIISGSTKWHNFMGNLKRGKMYGFPVSDTVVAIPEMEPYDFGPWGVFPLEGFDRKMEEMMAMYRTGAGIGVSYVRGDISCVQDSSALSMLPCASSRTPWPTARGASSAS